MNEYEKLCQVIAAYSTPYVDQKTKEQRVRYEVELLLPGVGTFRCRCFDDWFDEFASRVGQKCVVQIRARAYESRLYYTALSVQSA